MRTINFQKMFTHHFETLIFKNKLKEYFQKILFYWFAAFSATAKPLIWSPIFCTKHFFTFFQVRLFNFSAILKHPLRSVLKNWPKMAILLFDVSQLNLTSFLKFRHFFWFKIQTFSLVQVIYWDSVSGKIKPGNSDHFTEESILGWVLSGTYECKNNISPTTNIYSAHYYNYMLMSATLIMTTIFKSFSK